MLSTNTKQNSTLNLYSKLCQTRDEIHEELALTQSSNFGPLNNLTLRCEMGLIQLLQLSN